MPYESAGGSLKLKGVIDKKIKKKKKSSKSSKTDSVLKEEIKANKPDGTTNSNDGNGSNSPSTTTTTINAETVKRSDKKIAQPASVVVKVPNKTKAELAYERFNEKRNEDKIFKRAEKSHKERVELYNKHLDSLSEYNEMPKISWGWR